MNRRFCIYSVVLILGIHVGIFFSGCTADDVDDVVNDGDIFPGVTLSATTLDFGQVNVERFLIRTVTINNLNDEAITVERVTSTNAAFRIGGYFANGELIDLVVPFTVGGNGAIPIYVGFYPTEEKEYTGTLVIESINANLRAETDLVDLKGTGLPDID